MRRKLALGAGLVAATASLTLAVNGLVTNGRTTPSAAAEELTAFGDCDELLQWYIDRALPEVGPYGLSPGLAMPVDNVGGGTPPAPGPPQLGREAAAEPVGNSGTGTNVQEAGIDEPDRAKTDGELVVHVRRHTLVVTEVGTGKPEEVGRVRLPRRVQAPQLLLSGDTVLVLGSAPGFHGPLPVEPLRSDARILPTVPASFTSRMLEISVADPANPTIESDQTFGGSLVSGRQYDDTVRLVLRTEQPTLDFVQPNRQRTGREAEQANRQIVRESEIDDWLPTVEVAGERRPLVRCTDVRHPEVGVGFATLTVVTLPAQDPTARTTTAVTAAGDTVYSSADRLYLATRGDGATTLVHGFDLSGTGATYVASGKVPGVVRDRWSMDEHEGLLRVAVAHGDAWSPEDNGVTVLRERGGDLEVVGSVRGLGPGEAIKSVRWFDDLAVVVTFRQIDPVYTVDLAEPTSPRVLGELKIPGFSEYLHPIGGDRLLGVGQDADRRGRLRGGQVSLFDLSELSSPRRLATLDLGRRSEPAASHDPRAFTWIRDRQVAVTAVSAAWGRRAHMVELLVGDDGSLSKGRQWPLPRWSAAEGRALPLPDGSVAIVGARVSVVDVG